ncbi:MAG: hypothetical protein V3U52_03595 [Thermoplasmata archaeon]
MPEEEDRAFVVTKGSRYRLTSAESREKPMETIGTFKGFTTIGTDDALVMELDESHGDLSGKIRLIPLHMILSIDVIEAADEEEEDTGEPEKMYG